LKEYSGRFTPVAIDDMIVQIITGLDYIHTQLEFVHSDIKLDHILVNKEKKRFLIGHLGGAHRETMARAYIDEDYSAPELFHKDNQVIITEKCDIYSLGIMIKDIIRLTNIEEQKAELIVGWLKLSKRCCATGPTARPSCKNLLQMRYRRHE
jgi:serine/threonine protein kinase